jgi:hypothetical protein
MIFHSSAKDSSIDNYSNGVTGKGGCLGRGSALGGKEKERILRDEEDFVTCIHMKTV